MAILGAHMSIAGGLHKAVDRAVEAGCDCLQIFTGNPRAHDVTRLQPGTGRVLTRRGGRWQRLPLDDRAAAAFRDRLAEAGLRHPISHTSYLLNLAAADKSLWRKGIHGLVVELQRAEQLGIAHVVLHPGAHTVLSEQQGIDRVVAALDEVQRRTADLRSGVLLETTAGQGTNLGWRFEQLAAIIAGVAEPQRLGVCLDTCHLHAAGYELTTKRKYMATMRELDRIVGLKKVCAVHLNDSKAGLGARVDRHENIGHGRLGLEPFRLLLGDRRFRQVPMYLETPKEKHPDGEPWDVVNLRTLRSLADEKHNEAEAPRKSQRSDGD